MKQLTMTKVLTPLAALAFAFGVQAAAVSTETFDTYTAGTTVISNQTGWSFTYGTDGADDASAVTAYDNNAPASNLVPDGLNVGANYLNLSTEDGILFRNMDGTVAGNTVDLNAGLFVDTDVQFTVTDPSDRPAPTQDDKFIVWLEADNSGNTNLCVWAREYSINGTVGFNNSSNKVYTLGSANAIVPNAWYRLTVKAEQSVGGSFTFPAFKVYINGVAQTANEYIVDNPDDNLYEYDTVFGSGVVSGRAYLPAMTETMSSLSKVGFSGEGKIDSVAVTHDIPDNFPDLPRTAITFSWDSPAIASVSIGAPFYETVTSGSLLTVTPGQTFTMTVNYASGSSASTHDITAESGNNYVTVDGMVVTAASAGAATITFTATAKDTVDVTFDWSDIVTTMIAAGKQELSGITFTVGANGTPVSGDVQTETSKTLSGLKVGTNITITVTYSTTDWTTTITPASCMTKSGNVLTIESRPESGAATVTISAAGAAVKIGDTPYASLQEAVNAATSGATLKLAQNIALTEAVTVADGTTITVDLNGKTITGAAEVAVFTNAGALTITDTSANHDGQVVAGTDGVVVDNTGTLDLVYGAYTGTFTGTITSITADCSFSYDISAGESPVYDIADGYEMAVSAERYSLAVVTYTITYKKGETELELTPTAYTVEDNVTLPSATPDAGYTFTGWKDAEDNAVTDWVAGAKTGNLVLTAQFSVNTYTITYTLTGDSEGSGTAPAAGSYTVNSGTVTLTQPEAVSGYTFSGWYDNSGLTGSAVTTFTVDPAALEAKTFYGKFTQNAPVKPTIPENASTVEVAGNGSEDPADVAAYVEVAKPNAASEVADETYQGYFKKTATYDNVSGKWTVKAEIADDVEQTAATTAAAIVDGTSESGEVTVPAGLYYKVTTMTGLDGTGASSTSGLSTGAVEVTKPGTTQGFIKVQISTAPFAN